MKSIHLAKCATLLLWILFSVNSNAQTNIATYDFESGTQGWSTSTNSGLNNNSNWACDGSRSIYVNDDKSTSILTSPALNLLTYTQARITFCHKSNGVDAGEGFDLQYSNNGILWTTIKTFRRGTDFDQSGSGSGFSATNSFSVYINNTGSTAFALTSYFRFVGQANRSSESNYFDNIEITGFTAISNGPGGVTNGLGLWLTSSNGLSYTDGQSVSLWTDQGRGTNAKAKLSSQQPTYRNNINSNINFNPVVDFDNSYNPVPIDSDYSYDNTNTEFLEGPAGLYTQDIFIVLIPDAPINSYFGSMDVFCGDMVPGTNQTDATGVGLGAYTERFSGEILCYALGTQSGATGYGVADNVAGNNYDNPGIINTRNNAAATRQELYYNANNVETVQADVPSFGNVNNSRYWIGRSEGWEASTDARIAEIITYSNRKTDGSSERRRIESYLALKYGITLGTNGTSVNYVDSNGTTIWDVASNSGYNYDIAGIFRDDNSNHIQKQSKSVNGSSIVTIGLSTIELTNSANTAAFNSNRDYLVWGHNNLNMNTSGTPINVNLGPTTVTTITDVVNRKWKIVETGGDVPTAKISVNQSDLSGLPALVGNDAYVMIVADDSAFSSNVETVFLSSSSFNGNTTQETTYDFDGTKFFTFGVAHEVIEPRHLEFDGLDNYTHVGDKIDLTGSFTASAWVRTTGSNSTNSDKTIIAKHNGLVGYKFSILNNNTVRFSTGILPTNRIDSNVTLPNNVWHHVAVTYNGTTANLYIDGILDNSNNLTSPSNTAAEFSIGAVYESKTSINDYFAGDIDEIKIFNTVLNANQIRYMMNQEIEKNGSKIDGVIIPNSITKNDITALAWSNLLAYYSMNTYIGTHLNDVSGNANRASLIVPNRFSIEAQTAPLPYTSTTNGTWNNTTSWTNGSEQYIPGSASIVDPNITVDWNIVETSHNITMDNTSLPAGNNQNRSVLGLFVTANELELSGDTSTNAGNGLTVTHYLKIDGKIDLEGESQLIQTTDSDLDPTSSGSLERDQQGTRDLYTYNYWASPVGVINSTTNNNSYTLPSIFRDGSNPAAPNAINFITNGYNGTSGSPIGIADYWIWKYANQSGAYADWQHVRSTGSLLPGEGFTMKGIANTSGNVTLEQNYVYQGKPNNGDITLPITANNEYLVGNPYASALDAHQFIIDNAPTIQGTGATTGTLYFWEHWGGGSHILAEYQGGYATYNLSGATPAASLGTNDPLVATGGTPTKLPGRYIPVGQGFFVKSEATGTIRFNNAQRVFEKEGGASSIFMKSANTSQTTSVYNSDNRLKIRLGVNTVNGIHRQLLVTQDSHATAGHDWGYDGEITESQMDDMYWMIEGNKFIIQGTDVIDVNTVLPIGIHTDDAGNNTFTIDALENVPDNLDIYILDNATSTYHDIRANDFTINLPAGEYLDRFSMVFSTTSTLGIEDNILAEEINVYYNNSQESIVINNPKLHTITMVKLYNILSQEIFSETDIETSDYTALKTGKLSTGTYIINMKTDSGEISKKVLIE